MPLPGRSCCHGDIRFRGGCRHEVVLTVNLGGCCCRLTHRERRVGAGEEGWENQEGRLQPFPWRCPPEVFLAFSTPGLEGAGAEFRGLLNVGITARKPSADADLLSTPGSDPPTPNFRDQRKVFLSWPKACLGKPLELTKQTSILTGKSHLSPAECDLA